MPYKGVASRVSRARATMSSAKADRRSGEKTGMPLGREEGLAKEATQANRDDSGAASIREALGPSGRIRMPG